MTEPAADQVAALARSIEDDLKGTMHEERVRAIRARLEGPLRVAIAGRVKAGKSTLLNALVGERLAPTDAGECTRIVSWYRKGQGYQVTAKMKSGASETLAFQRPEGALTISLGGLAEKDIDAIDVSWPASTLDRVTLIDTPGLASINDENSRRTREFLEYDGDKPGDADAVIYLMRHLHKSDVAFLDAFMDRSVTAASPVNAVAVLSRADEIGAGRRDAMDSATRIATRYRDDPIVSSLAATCVPVAGLLAETGLTLREDEAAALRALAATPPEVLEQMLLSADQLCDLHASDLTVELRRSLLDRLGLFGVRIAIDMVNQKGATTAAALAPLLIEQSGLTRLRKVIDEHFLPRARVLQARSALVALRALARDLKNSNPEIADKLDRDAERIEASAVDFARVRAAHLIASGTVTVRDDERSALDLLLLGNGTAALGITDGANGDDVRKAALTQIERWRQRAGDPLASPALVEVFETAARVCEAHYAGATA
ncbi:MAG: dynamin family protein [Actinomycetota bacterium]|nr:dynamin family protein [Actinomycetota bacterium]